MKTDWLHLWLPMIAAVTIGFVGILYRFYPVVGMSVGVVIMTIGAGLVYFMTEEKKRE